MRYLLDTHTFIWSLDGDPRLKGKLLNIVKDNQNQIYLSVVSVWEIVIKVMQKKLKLDKELSILLKNLEFEILSINLEHILSVLKLPSIHKDPFDRMLVAQAKSENLALLTADPKIQAYFK